MSALDGVSAQVTHAIRKLRGGSQPLLVEADDGFTYVLKFIDNLQGRNLSFNEAMGSELYRAAGLPVPIWKPLKITEEFLLRNPQCWLETAEGRLRPKEGLCFGSRYLGREGVRLWEILPGSSFARVVNEGDFHLAWLLDICANHRDNRQAIFVEQDCGFHAVFVDHGHMFSGPEGVKCRQNLRASAYLDPRIYQRKPTDFKADLAQIVLNLDVANLWRRAEQLPREWLTDSALRNFAECLDVLKDAAEVQRIVELIAGFPPEKDQREFYPNERRRVIPDWLLRAGVQGA